MEVIKTERKLIIPMVLVVFLAFAFSGCSNNEEIKNVKENLTDVASTSDSSCANNQNSENGKGKSTAMTSTPDSNNTAFQNETPEFAYVYRIINNENCEDTFFRQSEDIKIFKTAIETGTPIDSPSELKNSPYVVELGYSSFSDAYFFYINQNSGWAYGFTLEKAFKLSKESIEDLNKLDFFSLQNAEDAAIAAVVKDHPGFPDKAGIKEVNEEVSGQKENKIPVKYETKVEEKAENIYTVTLTKTWGIKVQESIPVSYWKYDVSPEKIILVDENTAGEKLMSIIK